MRVAVLNDIHGNLPALEAVLDCVLKLVVDRIVVGGDVFPGPAPHLVLRQLRDLGIPVDFIKGNGEVAVLEHLAGKAPMLPESYRPLIRWNADQLNSAERESIAGWPMTLRLNLPPLGDVLFCHATPRNENEIFTHLTAEHLLIPIFDAANATVVVCGHTHIQFDRTVGSLRVVNAGSVGMPFGKPGAYWLLLDPDVSLRRTGYDLSSAADHIRATAYPHAAEFVARNILDPPSEAEMLDIYSRSEVQ